MSEVIILEMTKTTCFNLFNMNQRMFKSSTFLITVIMVLSHFYTLAQRPMEYLDRGLVGLQIENGVFLSWRMLGTDDPEIGFNLYKNGTKMNASPITASTNYVDSNGKATDKYKVETIIPDGDNEMSEEIKPWPRTAPTASGAESKPWLARLEIPLPEAPASDCIPGDMSVGDLDGDGDYELIFEWEGSISYIEAIDLEGNSLWRVNCGPNTTYNGICPMVYDLDGDGRAEMACKTGPGTIDGTGKYLSTGPAAIDDDSQILTRASGHLMEDPSYITVFNGMTGAEMATVNYWPPIGPLDEMEERWEDSYGKRSASIKAAVLYDKELGPLLVFTRGIYSYIGMGAYTWDGESLTLQWLFDSDNYPKNYRGQGNHAVAVADVDGDGSDELMYGACAIDNTGEGLYSTGFGHGDAHGLGDLIPDRPGMEFFQPHEDTNHGDDSYGLSMRDAATGEIIWEVRDASDVGRAWAGDVLGDVRGVEIMAVSDNNLRDCNGNLLSASSNAYMQPVYFDGDVQRELRSGASVNGSGRLFTGWYYSASSIHSTKEDANLVADIFGDWREEIILKRADNKAFVVFSTWFPTERKNYTLMHDPAYRMMVATQNVGYNQPANVSYYFPDGAPTPDIKLIKYDSTKVVEIVADKTKPVISAPSTQIEALTEDCDAYLTDYAEILQVNDEKYSKIYFKQLPESGAYIGNNGDSIEVAVIAADNFGNISDTVKFSVLAADLTPPTITKAFGNHSISAFSGCEKGIPDYTKYVSGSDFCSSDITITMSPEAGTILSGNGDTTVVTLYFDDNNGNVTDTSFTVTLNASQCFGEGVNDMEQSAVKIYPNPVNTTLTIELDNGSDDITRFEVYNAAGEMVLTETPNSITSTLNVEQLSTGLYILKVIGSTTTYHQCFMKM